MTDRLFDDERDDLTEEPTEGTRTTLPPVMPAPTFEGLAVGGPVDTQGIAGEQGAETETSMDDVAP